MLHMIVSLGLVDWLCLHAGCRSQVHARARTQGARKVIAHILQRLETISRIINSMRKAPICLLLCTIHRFWVAQTVSPGRNRK